MSILMLWRQPHDSVLQSVYKKDNPDFLAESLKSIAESTKCNEDIDLWFRLLDAGHRIKTLQEPVLHFRITDGTFKRRSVSKALNEYSIYSKNLRRFNRITKNDIIPLMRLVSRFFPKQLNKKLYLSQKRQKIFKENLMNIKSLNNQVFMKNGHIFEAVIQFEENGIQMIKAMQLDSHTKCVVELPLDEVELFKTGESVDVKLNIDSCMCMDGKTGVE